MDVLATMRRGALPKLPYDAEVEYLESNGGQYIDTNFKGSDDLDFSIDAMFTASGDNTFFGARYSYNGTGSRIYNLVSSGDGRFGFGKDGAYNKWGTLGIFINNRFRASKVGNLVSLSTGIMLHVSSEPFETPYEIELFAMSTETQARHRQEPLRGRIYSISFSKGGVSIGDFIPVRFTNERGETEGAMYDKVSGQLFRNAGTGAFIIGPDKQTFTQNLGVLMPQRHVELTARDYVQDGLIAMWDGIENAGLGVHDPNATVWKDLVEGLILKRQNGENV